MKGEKVSFWSVHFDRIDLSFGLGLIKVFLFSTMNSFLIIIKCRIRLKKKKNKRKTRWISGDQSQLTMSISPGDQQKKMARPSSKEQNGKREEISFHPSRLFYSSSFVNKCLNFIWSQWDSIVWCSKSIHFVSLFVPSITKQTFDFDRRESDLKYIEREEMSEETKKTKICQIWLNQIDEWRKFLSTSRQRFDLNISSVISNEKRKTSSTFVVEHVESIGNPIR